MVKEEIIIHKKNRLIEILLKKKVSKDEDNGQVIMMPLYIRQKSYQFCDMFVHTIKYLNWMKKKLNISNLCVKILKYFSGRIKYM